ncbi:uncharacterized protein RIC-3 isoform X3 [Epargyreus clarus]|uniref:uncharacterized protein RIC-3 isoform X3 n=1 Tax=Epargyreus clarus TaxID=520877 RepID=UPI003C2FE288
MANDEVIGPRKTMFVLVIVVGCFAVLWPRILSPLVLGPTREQIQPNQFDREAGCCEVIFETDVAVLELVNEVCSSAMGVGKLSPHSAAECRKAVNETCGVDIAVFLKRNENVGKTTKMLVETMQNSNSSCLREHFGVPVYSLGPHLASKSWDIKDTLKQERAPPMRGMGPHPALRERGRAIPPGPPGPPPPPARPVVLPPHVRVRSPLSVYYEVEQPPPIPGMRPPLGSPGGPVPTPKSTMGFVMPVYTICIIVFFAYTLSKIMFRRTAVPYDPVAPDPQFRRRVFRDDSRSSPDKLGDAELAALRARLAETERAMQRIVGQLARRDADVQDNARPYTNGTILLNTGPVQIVASEYKESKEKTPEPVNEQEATPEPNEAEPTKVAKEPLEPVEASEPAVEPKESSPDVREPSPEPALTLDQTEAAPETVVVTESIPDLPLTQDQNEPIPEPLETIPKSEVVKEPSPDTVEQLPEISQEERLKESITNESLLTSEVKDYIPEPKELTPEGEIAKESTPEPDQLSEKPSTPKYSSYTAQILDSSDQVEPICGILETVPQPTEPISELKESAIETNKLVHELEGSTPIPEDATPEPKEPTPVPIESVPESKESTPEPKELTPELKELTPEPIELTPDTKELTPETNKPVSKSEEPIPDTKESLLDSEEFELRDSTPDSKQSSPECDLVKSESKETTTDVKEITPDTKDPIPDTIEPISDTKESIPDHKDPTQKHPSSELTESSQELDAPVVESRPQPSLETSGLKEPTPQSKEPSPEPKLTTEPENSQTNLVEDSSVPEETLIDLNEAIADVKTQKEDDEELVNLKEEKEISSEDIEIVTDKENELIKVFEGTEAKDDSHKKATEKFLDEQRFVLVSKPDVTEESKNAGFPEEDLEEEEIENAAVKVVGMELTAHPADGGAWPRDLRPAPRAAPAPAPHEAEEVKSIFLETEIPQQSRVLVAQFAQDREQSDKPRPAKHAPLVVSGKMTLSLIQDAPRETPERDPESTLDDFTTASALTQPAAEKGEMESDEEVDEEIEVEEIEEEYEEDEEDEEAPAPAPVKAVKK